MACRPRCCPRGDRPWRGQRPTATGPRAATTQRGDACGLGRLCRVCGIARALRHIDLKLRRPLRSRPPDRPPMASLRRARSAPAARWRRLYAKAAPWLHFQTGQQFDIAKRIRAGLGAGLMRVRRIFRPFLPQLVPRILLLAQAAGICGRLVLRERSRSRTPTNNADIDRRQRACERKQKNYRRHRRPFRAAQKRHAASMLPAANCWRPKMIPSADKGVEAHQVICESAFLNHRASAASTRGCDAAAPGQGGAPVWRFGHALTQISPAAPETRSRRLRARPLSPINLGLAREADRSIRTRSIGHAVESQEILARDS